MWIEASGGGGGTQITPSDATPVALVNGETYEVGGNGYAIESYTDVQPLYNSDYNFAIGEIVKNAGSYPGTIVRSRGSITPSADGAAFSNSGWYKMTSGGYAYSQKPLQTATGTFTTNTTATTGYKVTLGFKPKYLCIIRNSTQTAYNMIYNEDLDATKYNRGTAGANAWRSFEAVSPYSIESIDNDGFTVYTASGYSSNEWRYFAIG